jgi:hypothetical protein
LLVAAKDLLFPAKPRARQHPKGEGTAAAAAAAAAAGTPAAAFIATDNVEAVVSSSDAIVELVGVTNIHHAANNFGLVTLHV